MTSEMVLREERDAGREEGREEGRQEGLLQAVRSITSAGVNLETLAQWLHMSLDEIKSLLATA